MSFSWIFRVTSSFEGFHICAGSSKTDHSHFFRKLTFCRQIDSVVPDPLHWPLQLFTPPEINDVL